MTNIFFALLKGYCCAKKIDVVRLCYHSDGIDEALILKPWLIVLPFEWVLAEATKSVTEKLKHLCTYNKFHAISVMKHPNNEIVESSFGTEWLDTANNPFEAITKIDGNCR